MSGMDNQQRGALNVLLVPVVGLCVVAIGIGVFAFWAYGSREDYKNNDDQKISSAVQTAIQNTRASDAKQYAQASKYPLDKFVGPSSFGSVTFKYPKTWSGYVPEESSSQTPIDGYFYPAIVPDITNNSNNYALRVQVIEQTYATSLQQLSSNVSSGGLSISQYTLPKLPNVIGSLAQGQISTNNQGTMVIMPILNMTLEVWTEAPQFQSDFMNVVLPSLTFQP